jgi:AraC family transcriptional regulator
LRRYTAFPPRIPDRSSSGLRPELYRAVEYIHDNLDRDISLREIANAAGLSSNYLTTLFRQATGYSLHQHLIRQRINKASTLLRRSDLTIGEIASRVGFYDSSHLVRHFKRLTGLTPRALRKRS